MPEKAGMTELIDMYDQLKDRILWAHGIVSLMVTHHEAYGVVGASAHCASRHLQETLDLLCQLREWQERLRDQGYSQS